MGDEFKSNVRLLQVCVCVCVCVCGKVCFACNVCCLLSIVEKVECFC